MTKPTLPPIPSSLKDRAYRPSGIFTWQTLTFTIILGIPIALLAGGAASYVGLWFPGFFFENARELMNSIAPNLSAVLFLKLYALLIMLTGVSGYATFPLATGLVLGRILIAILRRARCRSSWGAATIGLLTSALAYAALQTFRVHTISILDTSWSLANLSPSPLSPWLHFSAIAVDSLLWCGTATYSLWAYFRHTPFCEGCGVWYRNWKQGYFELLILNPLLAVLDTGTPAAFIDLRPIPSDKFPHSLMEISSCPSCNASPCNLKVTIHWKDKEWSGEYSQQCKWLNIMIPPSVVDKLVGLHEQYWVTAPSSKKKLI